MFSTSLGPISITFPVFPIFLHHFKHASKKAYQIVDKSDRLKCMFPPMIFEMSKHKTSVLHEDL